MGKPDAAAVEDALQAARELAQVACHLADLAGQLSQGGNVPEHEMARAAALEASLRAARSVFSLDDALETTRTPDEMLAVAADTLAVAEDAVRCAREAVEASLPPTVRR